MADNACLALFPIPRTKILFKLVRSAILPGSNVFFILPELIIFSILPESNILHRFLQLCIAPRSLFTVFLAPPD